MLACMGVRDRQPITYGEAKSYVAGLPEEDQNKSITGCYKVFCPKDSKCCADRRVGCTCVAECCGCVWTPTCSWCLLDVIVGMCFCNCKKAPGLWNCVDNKGTFYGLVKVDAERGSLAWFSESQVVGSKGDEQNAQCYCMK